MLRVCLEDVGDGLAAFSCSPAQEALRSLHVLSDVRHHPLHISWALHARERMAPALRHEADAFAFWWLDRPLLPSEIWPVASVRSWEEELGALRVAPVQLLADEMLHVALTRFGPGPRIPLGEVQRNRELREQALAGVAARHPPSAPVIEALVADPEGCRERFATFLASYWDACVAPEWPAMAERLQEDIAARGRTLSGGGLLDMLAELSPHVHVEEGAVVLGRPGRLTASGPESRPTVEVHLTELDQVVLVPSHFIWPELTAIVQRDRREGAETQTVVVVYAVADMQRAGRPPSRPRTSSSCCARPATSPASRSSSSWRSAPAPPMS